MARLKKTNQKCEIIYIKEIKILFRYLKKTEATLVFFSTVLVYGHSKNYSNEKSILNPNSDYAKIKVKTENLYNKTCKKFLILRVGNVYDDQLSKKGLLKNLIEPLKTILLLL